MSQQQDKEPQQQPPTNEASQNTEMPATNDDVRVLKRGDLVRVAERRGPGIKNRDGGLGRIHKVIPSLEESFAYEVDFVLGGRICNVPRQDLMYTTADAEGMTTKRQKRDRNPSTAVKEMEETKLIKKAPAPRRKKKATSKKTTTAKKAKSAAGAKHKGKNGKVAGKKTSAKGKGAAKGRGAAKAKQQEETVVVKNLYEPHKRELEKCLARLEKQDTYAFFLGDAPPEYDEHYGDDEKESAVDDSINDPAAAALTPPKPPALPVFPTTPPFNFTVIRKRMAHGRYVLDRVRQHKERTFSRTAPALVHPKGVDWNLFRNDVVQMCDAAIARDPEGVSGGRGTLGHAAEKTKNHVLRLYDSNGRRQMKELEDDEARHKFYYLLKSKTNNEAAMQGKWRKTAFPERIYERLSSDVVCAGLSSLDERTAVYELQTSLPDSFVGLSYAYTDTRQSEGWMKSVLDDTKGINNGAEERKAARDLANDDGVVRAQVQATMTCLLINVQDRLMTEAGVLKDDELKSANWAGDVAEEALATASADNISVETAISADSPDIVEQPVWGIDCYTRKNITLCIEKDFDSAIALEFIEKWLLPAINACPVSVAHNMINAARILEGLSLPSSTVLEEEHGDDSGDERWSHSLLGKALKDKMNKIGPPWLKSVAHQLRLAISTIGHDFFRVHPKGHGAIVLQPKLKANTLVTFYRGEVYPSWRWGEKMDAIELTQNRLGLRPNLPDFYNMALERPQVDPRGYGLLFVDASRKAGHGSSLSHSCEPTCEVRVAAVDGQLRLAMTTIRELELGEELTFDYNAVTESLNEYRSAVCLCGHGRCRGSFLHFATADCYQEVLNRNSPIAVRVSNIIKGCAKQVMSEADEKLLASHGFGTAAFGAASFKRALEDSDSHSLKLDSMENVPIWLRTYVADTIRYIEYERRALPVMLLCNDLKRTEANADSALSKKSRKNDRANNKVDSKPAKKQKKTPKDESGPIKGSKPEPVFLFFSRKRSDFFRSQLIVHGMGHLKGREQQCAMMKVASSCWKALGDDMKQRWKEKAIQEWKENGGEEKARLEAERQKAEKATAGKRKPGEDGSDGAKKKRKKSKQDPSKNEDVAVHSSRISFEAADAEGVSAMEQRIQQLTQTLSRVGRVLGRHRESSLRASQSSTESIHSPLANLSDDDVVYWLWRHENGPVRSLLRSCSSEKCVSPSLLDALKATEKKFSALLRVGTQSDPSGNGLYPPDARTKVTEALLELRQILCSGLLSMEGELKQHELERSRLRNKAYRAKKKKDAAKAASLEASGSSNVRETVSSVLDGIVDAVVARSGKPQSSNDNAPVQETVFSVAKDSPVEEDLPLSSWLQHFTDRWKLEAAADLLLFYAHTNTFFAIKPYAPLESTPIEVYSRELGNAVPRSVVETAQEKTTRSNDIVLVGSEAKSKAEQGAGSSLADDDTVASHTTDAQESTETIEGAHSKPKTPKAKSRALCKPDDIITNVTITYRGDYVLSQLLQWYNGGIGQKPGLPEMAGCVVLPSMSGPWQGTLGGKAGKNKPTRYASEVRPMLLEWLHDPHKRGNAFEGQLGQVFPGSAPEQKWDDAKFSCSPVGSPVLDFLVTGDDSSLRKIATALSETIRSTETRNHSTKDGKSVSATERLQNTVDEGMPAQAVSHWVQCENPDCLKWRKLPWHVDVDALPEKFVCSDNKWDPAASSCDAPEDTWDEYDQSLNNDGIAKQSDAGILTADGEVSGSEIGNNAASEGSIDAKEFVIAARFDVLRTGKDYYSTGEVVDVSFSDSVKRVKFHFPKTKAMYDEWIEIDSPRIAPHQSMQHVGKGNRPKKKAAKSMAPVKNEKPNTVVATSIPPEQTLVGVNAKHNATGSDSLEGLKAQLLAAAAAKMTVKPAPVSSAQNAGSFVHTAQQQQSYATHSTSHSDNMPRGQFASHRAGPLAVAGTYISSPVKSPERNVAMSAPVSNAAPSVPLSSASFTIPRKSPARNDAMSAQMNEKAPVVSSQSESFTIPRKAAFQRGNDPMAERIPRKPRPPPPDNSALREAVLANGTSRFLGMATASDWTRTAFGSNYFQPSLQEQMYQSQLMQQGQRQHSMPNQYFDGRNYWQGRHHHHQHHHHQQNPRRYGGSPNKR